VLGGDAAAVSITRQREDFLMSMHRQTSSAATAAGHGARVVPLPSAEELAFIARQQDPFGIAHMCCHPGGHQPIRDGEIIACYHCDTVFWP